MATLTDRQSVAARRGRPIIDDNSVSGAGEGALMDSAGSVSCWIEDTRNGCEWAAARLWERYREQMLALARRKLGEASRRISDEEDVAVIAFHSFLRRSRSGAYPHVGDRHQLWRLLVKITVHKALNQLRNGNRLKRGGDLSRAPEPVERPLREYPGELTSEGAEPDLIVTMSDSMDYLLGLLDDQELQQIAIAKLNGYSNLEIAETIRRSLPTVERRLRLIRDVWREELQL